MYLSMFVRSDAATAATPQVEQFLVNIRVTKVYIQLYIRWTQRLKMEIYTLIVASIILKVH